VRRPETLQEWFGRSMASCRILAGVSPQEMAQRLNVQQPYVTKLERGQWVNIDPHKLLEYAKLGLDVTTVLREWQTLSEPEENDLEAAVSVAAEEPLRHGGTTHPLLRYE
jgi:transcriptional regulator with XRE-family HTH domain